MSGPKMTGIREAVYYLAWVYLWGERYEINCRFCVDALSIPNKLLNVQVPQLFKSVIDTLNVDIAAGSTVWIVAGSIILGCMS